MPKTDGRPARPGEVPAFGSVWTWGDLGVEPYIVLGVQHGALLYLDATGRVNPYAMRWAAFGTDTEALPQWRCIAEGPK